MNTNSKIAEYILRAQNASDGGKNINILVQSRRSIRDNCAGYAHKDMMILSALELIRRTNNNFKYSVTPDREGVARYIVYFQTVVNGEKIQTSFHSFDDSLKRYCTSKSFRIKWDHGDSRLSALRMYSFYCDGNYGGDYLLSGK